jgi:hypothetical protein
MSEGIKLRELVEDVARVADGDYPTGFKMLGFVLYVSEYGAEDLLSGYLVSPRTYYRWVDTVKAAGWDSVLADVRFKQALRGPVRLGPQAAREVRSTRSAEEDPSALSPTLSVDRRGSTLGSTGGASRSSLPRESPGEIDASAQRRGRLPLLMKSKGRMTAF